MKMNRWWFIDWVGWRERRVVCMLWKQPHFFTWLIWIFPPPKIAFSVIVMYPAHKAVLSRYSTRKEARKQTNFKSHLNRGRGIGDQSSPPTSHMQLNPLMGNGVPEDRQPEGLPIRVSTFSHTLQLSIYSSPAQIAEELLPVLLKSVKSDSRATFARMYAYLLVDVKPKEKALPHSGPISGSRSPPRGTQWKVYELGYQSLWQAAYLSLPIKPQYLEWGFSPSHVGFDLNDLAVGID